MDDGIEYLSDRIGPQFPPPPEDCQCKNGGVCRRCYDEIWDTVGKAGKE